MKLTKDFNNQNCRVLVTKKTLVEKALADKSNSYVFNDSFKDQNLFIFLDNPIDCCKILKPYIDKKKVSFVTFLSNNGSLFDVNYFNELSNLPSENEIKSKLVSLMKAPLNKFHSIIKEPLNQIVRILNNKSSN